MKTLTEFSGFVLKEAMAKKAALITEGKTEEEAQAAINEQLKLDETKIPFYKNAIDMTSSRLSQVKRVVVAVKATETEVVPTAFVEREGHFYLLEYFAQAGSHSAGRDSGDSWGDRGRGGRGGGGRGDSRGGRGNDRGRGGDSRGGGRGDHRGRDEGRGRDESRGPSGDRAPSFGGDRPPREASEFRGEPRAPRPPREQLPPNPNAASFVSTGMGTLAPRPAGEPRAPRPPRNNVPRGDARPPREPRGPKGAGELRLVFKGQSATHLQGSGTSAPAAAEAPAAADVSLASASNAQVSEATAAATPSAE